MAGNRRLGAARGHGGDLRLQRAEPEPERFVAGREGVGDARQGFFARPGGIGGDRRSLRRGMGLRAGRKRRLGGVWGNGVLLLGRDAGQKRVRRG